MQDWQPVLQMLPAAPPLRPAAVAAPVSPAALARCACNVLFLPVPVSPLGLLQARRRRSYSAGPPGCSILGQAPPRPRALLRRKRRAGALVCGLPHVPRSSYRAPRRCLAPLPAPRGIHTGYGLFGPARSSHGPWGSHIHHASCQAAAAFQGCASSNVSCPPAGPPVLRWCLLRAHGVALCLSCLSLLLLVGWSAIVAPLVA